MRVYQPQNELGQALLNEGQLVSVTKSLTKELTNGTIILSSSDITDIDAWDVSSVKVSIGGSQMCFKPDVSKGTGTIKITFAKERFSELGFDRATILLSLISSNGIGSPVEQELSIEVLISNGIANNDKEMIEKGVDKVIATGDVEQIQAVGAQLAASGIPEYRYAGVKSPNEILNMDSNLGAFGEQPLFTKTGEYSSTKVTYADPEFTANIMSLESGQFSNSPPPYNGMFCKSNITKFDTQIPSVTNAQSMFQFCTGLTSWDVPLPQSLTNATYMFWGCSGLTSWNGTLPESLTTATSMFQVCRGLTSWDVPLPNSLTNANGMFWGCSGLTSWDIPLPNSLTNATYMFSGCTGLTSWDIPLPNSLTNASNMFYGCTNLTSFTPWGKNEDGTSKDTGATGNLTNGYQMFHNCKLDLASVKRISDWLPTRTSSKPTGSESSSKEGWIHIGVAEGVNSGDEFNNAISKITGKKWSVVICVNGSHTTK